MFANQFQQGNRVITLVNNVSNKSVVSSSWQSSSSSYGVFTYYYLNLLNPGNTYFVRCKVKYTTGTGSPRNWMRLYQQNGSVGWGAGVSSPAENTEYTLYNVATVGGVSVPSWASYSEQNNHGTLYSGDGGTVNGTTNYWKELLILDVTEILEDIDRLRGASSRASWCNINIPFFTDYYYLYFDTSTGAANFSATLPAISNITNVNTHRGFISANDFVESSCLSSFGNCNGGNTHYDPYFDAGSNNISVYNNAGGGTVTITREAAQSDSPFKDHGYNLKIVTNGAASPGAGGFYCGWLSYASAIFVERFVAKIPTGYSVYDAANAQGDGATTTWLTSQAGTGAWKEYAMLRRCGATGSFSTGGHIYLSGSNNTSVTWYLAYCGSYDVTGNENLIYSQVLEANARIRNEVIYTSSHFNSKNLVVNGDGRYGLKNITNTNWTLDYADKMGNAVASFCQPYGVGTAYFSEYIPVDLGKKYKLHCWAKRYTGGNCLLALQFFTASYSALYFQNTMYWPGTRTTLASPVANGATTLTLTSAANWNAGYSQYYQKAVGFRTASSSYHNVGYWGSPSVYITNITGNVVTMSGAWTGSTIAAGTDVVQGNDGGNYIYPLNLIAGQWAETTYIFSGCTEGKVNGWNSSKIFPIDTKYMRVLLNLYTNNSTDSSALKISDFSIEVVDDYVDGRNQNKLSIV